MGKSYKEQREWELKRGIETDRIKSKKQKLKDKFIEDTDWNYEHSDESSNLEIDEKHIKNSIKNAANKTYIAFQNNVNKSIEENEKC
jgi:cell division septum initiation protein DivIVA